MFHSTIEEIPQDKIDAIVNQLAGNDSSLTACSHVSKRWQARCRQQSFRRARLADLHDLQSSNWYPGNPPIVHHHDTRDGELWITPPKLPHNHVHFKSFSQITYLTLSHFSATPFDPPTLERTFCDLTTTVTNLRLLQPMACPNSLLCLLSAFRNLQDTMVHAPCWEDARQDGSIAVPTQFRGNLSLSGFDDESSLFLLLLGSTATVYERITLDGCSFRNPRPLQQFISAAGKNARRLRIIVPDHGVVPTFSIAECSILEELSVSVPGATTSFHSIPSLLASTTSSCFRRLVLELRTSTRRERDATQLTLADGISQLDGPLSRLAQNATKTDRQVSLVLLGRDPEFLAQGLLDFQELGCVWAGEDVGGGEYSWSFAAPKNGKARRYRTSILDKLLRWKISQ